jgi:hypothetical protein
VAVLSIEGAHVSQNAWSEKIAAWGRCLAQADFLGEIALSEEDTLELMHLLGSEATAINGKLQLNPLALAVAAVNWAYWREADDGAYVESFMLNIVGDCNRTRWLNDWGPTIEDAICGVIRGEQRREGPYRFVGLIARHAGVPHTKIQQLSALLGDLAEEPGWHELPRFADTFIIDRVNSHFSNGRNVSGYLTDPAGIAYIRSLCADLLWLAGPGSGHADDLPSYRPGLLAELRERLQAVPVAKVTAQRSPMPFVQLDSSGLRLELIVPEALLRSGGGTCNQLKSGKLFLQRVAIGGTALPVDERFCGKLMDGSTWSTMGWTAASDDAWAIFRNDGRLLSTQRHGNAVPSGEYWMVCREGFDISGLSNKQKDDEFVFAGVQCHLLRATLVAEDDGKLPKLRVGGQPQPWIECLNAGPLTGFTSFDAVCDGSTQLVIHDWSPAVERRYRLTATSNQVLLNTKLIPAEGGVHSVTFVEPPPVGAEVEVRLTPVGYRERERVAQVVRLVRFPGSLKVQQGLYPYHEGARVRVEVNGPISLTGPVVTYASARAIELSAESGSRTVSAILEQANAKLEIHIPVQRAGLWFEDEPGRPAIFDKQSLKDASEAEAGVLVLCGLPDESVDLVAKFDDGGKILRSALKLGANGLKTLAPIELLDVINPSSGVAALHLRTRGRLYDTGARVIEPTVRNLDPSSSFSVEALPCAAAAYMRLLRDEEAREGDAAALADVDWIDRRARLIRAVDAVLAEPVLPAPEQAPRKDDRPWLSQLTEFCSCTPGNAAELGAWSSSGTELLSSCPLPHRPSRWNEQLQRRIADVTRQIDLVGPLNAVLRGGNAAGPAFAISHGWGRYAAVPGPSHFQLGEIANGLARLENRPAPWGPFAKRLRAWVLLRLGYRKHFIEDVRASKATGHADVDASLEGLDAAMNAIADLLASGHVHPALPKAPFLSRREDDRLLMAALAGGHTEWRCVAEQ